MKNEREYFIGLDIGTDSVGYAVTDDRYKLLKFKGEPMWGSHLFDAASQCADRRGFRTARRRLDRRQQRVKLVDEIMAKEVAKVDERFYIRKKESALWREDKSSQDDIFFLFNDEDYTDKDYHREYPTIHHLIMDIIDHPEKKFDIRLINIALDWLVAHRGHFLSDISPENADKVLSFDEIYSSFIEYFDNNDLERPWKEIDANEFGNILKLKGANAKKQKLNELLYGGKPINDENYFLNKKVLVDFLSGRENVKANALFVDSEYEDDIKITISGDMDIILPQLGDDAEIVARMAAMYEWSVLSDILTGSKYISEAKIKVYDQHRSDLKRLKAFVRKNAPDKYYEIFNKADSKINNYVAYSYNLRSVKTDTNLPQKAARKDFYDYLKKTLSLDKIVCEGEDLLFLEELKTRITDGTFMPKQVNSDNRVIPYQLYYREYARILENASIHYSFFNEKDSDGYLNIEKLRNVFTFRIPYYVGPLRKDNSSNAWIVRKAEGKIYPWNFDDMVDRDKSEDEFINRMTNSCTYLPQESVLPKYSVLYSKFMVLNEINNIMINDKQISVEAKQGIYNDLFCKYAKVTPKKIKDYLCSEGYITKEDIKNANMTGIDTTIKSSLKAVREFHNLLERKILTLSDVDKIVERSTYTEDKVRFKKWIKREFPKLNDDDYKHVCSLKYKDFGRLSRKFLAELEGASRETGEVGTIMYFLWNTNENLMKLLSDRYTFAEKIADAKKEYYTEHSSNINEQMDDLGISNAVKRQVTRTLAVVKDITQSLGCAPKKIFVEMARGADEKKQRTVTRKEQILELYKNAKEDTKELVKQLEAMGDTANNQLQSEKLFLYYMQLGKSMYSGKAIDITQLKSNRYNIDHIYPQSLVKDDSILNNKVLVFSEENAAKDDGPVIPDVQKNMRSFWLKLKKNGLITDEKYSRLIRSTPFTNEEKMGFINRQLVETRQSMKAVTQLLKNIFPDTEIVYVKAKLASDFRQKFDLPPKSRIINDLHHAKDAYLNVVVGNVYNERFNKRNFNINEKYTLNIKVIFSKELIRGQKVIWNPLVDFDTVKRTYTKNNIHLTRYAYCQKGGLYKVNPLKKTIDGNLVPLKSHMSVISKYGGYDKPISSFFTVVRYYKSGKRIISIVPIDLMYASKFLADNEFASQYVVDFLEKRNRGKKVEGIELPFGKRVVKYKSIIELDGLRYWINSKQSNGEELVLSSAESVYYSIEKVGYIKKIENYIEKKTKNRNLQHDPEHDGLSEKLNVELYDEILSKMMTNHLTNLQGNQYETLIKGKERFIQLDFDSQVTTLLECIKLLKTGRVGGCNLSMIGGKAKTGAIIIKAAVSEIKKYNDIRIIDVSPAGLHEQVSINLKDLL